KKLLYIYIKTKYDLTEIVVDKSAANSTYDEFLSSLPQDDPRFAVYGFGYEKPGDYVLFLANKYTKTTRLFLLIISMIRIPDTSKVRQKMLYAPSKDALRRNLVGIAIEIQRTDASEIN
ncbi:actin depolymerizing protein, partial [Backusella circina FSU 941]